MQLCNIFFDFFSKKSEILIISLFCIIPVFDFIFLIRTLIEIDSAQNKFLKKPDSFFESGLKLINY
jgi:hypothetical protein